MKIRFRIEEKIKNLTFLLICLFVFLFQINSQILNALPMEKYKDEIQFKFEKKISKFLFIINLPSSFNFPI